MPAEVCSSEELRSALEYTMQLAFIEYMRGYRVQGIFVELWDEILPYAILNGPAKVLTDYASYFQRRSEPPPPLGQRPFLLGLTREEVLRDFSNVLASVFVHTPPRLGFTRAEQRMLRQAVFGYTDIELAQRLHLALSTIKNRWRALYERLALVAPGLAPQPDPSFNEAVRGQEKRRRLLEYVRRHPEELRPGLWRTRLTGRKARWGEPAICPHQPYASDPSRSHCKYIPGAPCRESGETPL